MRSHSRLQQPGSTSSGMAEFYGLSGAAEEAVGFSGVFEFFGYVCDTELLTDSSAAKGMSLRLGQAL